jgi:catalase-peroxidase
MAEDLVSRPDGPAGNCALESMGTFGFAGGRGRVEINWGTEETWLDDKRYSGDRELANPGAVQMGPST